MLRGLSAEQLAGLEAVCSDHVFAPGIDILSEGASDPFVHILMDGTAHLSKRSVDGTSMQMGSFGSGDVVGELKLVHPSSSSASVIASSEVRTVAIDIAAFEQSTTLTAARATVIANVGAVLAERLRATTTQTADALKRELDESRRREHAGRFSVAVCAGLAIYQLATAALLAVPQANLPAAGIMSLTFLVLAIPPTITALKASPFPLESYGLTLRDGSRVVGQALLWTLPVLLLMVGFKMWGMTALSVMAAHKLFDPAATFSDGVFDLKLYVLYLLIYLIHTPLQEYVARAVFQGTLQHFIPNRRGGINWAAILISNLVFAAVHSLYGIIFCIGAFLPGLFWGWLFARQKSVLGAIASHIAIGVMGLFILGLEVILG